MMLCIYLVNKTFIDISHSISLPKYQYHNKFCELVNTSMDLLVSSIVDNFLWFSYELLIRSRVYFARHMIPCTLRTSFIIYYSTRTNGCSRKYYTSRIFQLYFTLYNFLYIILASNTHPMSNNKLLSSFLRWKLIHIFKECI